jgi:hypothetical protein
MARVTGIGGVFFKSTGDHKALAAWYQKHLGMPLEPWGGADVAEAFEVVGNVRAYQPGDVLEIATDSDRRVTRSGEAYSTRIIGVYATKPGVLLTELNIDDPMDHMVPVGVIGVIPTKVTAENGVIHRGDLLVSAGTRGHAMRADRRRLEFGMVLGKALEEFSGPGSGLIRVLVNVK